MTALEGARIMLTRTAEDCAGWARQLERRGAVPVVFPCIECELLTDGQRRAALERALPQADWLVFTSARGVSAFAALLDRPLPAGTRIAAVGPATADAARTLGPVALIGEGGTAASLAAALETVCRPGEELLLAVAENAGSTIERALAPRGVKCTRLDVYRTVPMPVRQPKQTLSALAADNIFLASPSAVTGLVNQLELDRPAAIWTIGPSTTAAAEASGLDVAAEAQHPGLEGLLEVMQCTNV